MWVHVSYEEARGVLIIHGPLDVVVMCYFSHISSSFSTAKKIDPIIQIYELPEINILPRMCVCVTSWTHQEICSQSWFILMLAQLCPTL